MKIPNYDNNKNEAKKRSLNNFLNEEFRMLICGQSNCGKTNLLMHILRKPLVFYDKIIFHTPNRHQDKIKDLESLMDDISEKVGYGVMEIKTADEIMDTEEYPNNNRKIVVFDDLINCCDKIQSKIANHYSDGRHHNISPIYLSQSYYDVPQKIRLNSSHMLLYPPATKNHSNLIGKENRIDPNSFDKLMPFEFLFIDKENKTCKKNFDEIV